MRFRRCLKGPANFPADCDRPGEEVDGTVLKSARRGGAEEFPRCSLERFERDVHGLKLSVSRADHRPKRNKAKMLIQFELPRGAADDREVVTPFDAMLPQQRQDSLQDLRTA